MSEHRPSLVVHLCLALLVLGAACGDDQAADIRPAIAVDGNQLSFGEVVIDTEADRSLSLRAAVQAPLTVRAIDFEAADGVSAAAFSVLDPLPVLVPALSNHTIRIRFQPTEARPYQAVAVIRSNDRERPEVRVELVGTGIVGSLDVTACLPSTASEPSRCADTAVQPPTPLSLGDVVAGGHAQAQVVVFNRGRDVVHVSEVAFADPAAAADAGFRLPAALEGGTSIPGREAGEFRVDFHPPAGTTGPAAATLRIVSDSPVTPLVELELQAQVHPNRDPLACLFVREIRRVGGGVEHFEPGDPLPLVQPSDVVLLDAAARPGCSGDPEDGTAVTLDWSLSAPRSTTRLIPVSGEPMQRILEIEAEGSYVVELEVADQLGARANVDEQGRPARVTLNASRIRDLLVEVDWQRSPGVDVDLHFVRGSAANLWNAQHDVWWNNRPDWGVAGDVGDDPELSDDVLGTGIPVEGVALDRPEPGQTYWVFARFTRDDARGRSSAPTCSTTCDDGLVCSAGRCMEPVLVELRVFFFGEAVSLDPAFENPVALHSVCDTWRAGRIEWPASAGGTPRFVPDVRILADGTPNAGGATCDLQ